MTIFTGRFAGKTAIVTGGASGLGLGAATRIVAEGGRVALWDLNHEALQRVTSIKPSLICAVDVADYGQVKKAANQSKETLEKVDILVTCAGITGATTSVTEFPVDNWRRVLDVSLTGVFYCCREIVPFMEKEGYGRVFNVASVAGNEGNPNASAYSDSKAGVIGFTKSLGKELATKGGSSQLHNTRDV
jgi:2-dehydro-3-deoxy-L-rhamnonate dehydrogenase (NAD+)